MLKSALIIFVMKTISKYVSVLSMEMDPLMWRDSWGVSKFSSSIKKERERNLEEKKSEF
jgi:hypothetical protein